MAVAGRAIRFTDGKNCEPKASAVAWEHRCTRPAQISGKGVGRTAT